MSLMDAKNTPITCNGQTIGGVISYQFFRGIPREVNHRPLNGNPVSLPSYPDFGRCVMPLYRDTADLGQIELNNSLINRTVVEFVITFSNGNVQKFQGYCLTLPSSGTKTTAGDKVVASQCEIRISGALY